MAKGRSSYDFPEAGNLPAKVDITIANARFARTPNYNSGKTLCLVFSEGEVHEALDSSGDAIELDLNETPLLYPCGEGWDSFDNGATASHDRLETFYRTTLVARALGALIELGVDLESRGEATEAKTWEGLHIVFERQHIEFGKDKDGKVISSDRLMPVKFVGEEGSGKKGKGSAKSKATKAAAANEDEDEAPKKGKSKSSGIDLDDIDDKILKKLRKSFAVADDAGEFAELAIEIDGVSDDDGLMNAIADESLYEALEAE